MFGGGGRRNVPVAGRRHAVARLTRQTRRARRRRQQPVVHNRMPARQVGQRQTVDGDAAARRRTRNTVTVSLLVVTAAVSQ